VLSVEEDLGENATVMIVTKDGICLNAAKDDIPTQGRVSTGVRGIMLREGDYVVFMKQLDEESEGEIVIATSEGKFKRVISSLIEPSKRYRKGNIIVSMPDGASVISASHVTAPYLYAVVDKDRNVSELSSEDIFIAVPSNKAKKISRYAEGSVEKVIPMPYKKDE
jgi:DNA gyrase/topoisomerase IV subunit A